MVDATTHTALRWTRRAFATVLAALALAGCANVGGGADPLPSWNDGANKQAILKFVADVTTTARPPSWRPADRIAVFDNDGTLWAEQPIYTQFAFMLERVKATAPQHPEWRDNPVFKALVANDQKALAAMSEKRVLGFSVLRAVLA